MAVKVDSKKLNKKIEKLLNNVGYIIENEAINRCPVETGRLRASIQHKVISHDTVIIGTVGTPYAIFVEFGTLPMAQAHGIHIPEVPITSWEALNKRGGAGQSMPFLRTALFKKEKEIKNEFKKILGG